MALKTENITFDCTDPEKLADWWARAVGEQVNPVAPGFFVTVTRKVAKPLSADEAADRIRELAMWRVFAPTAADVLGAIEIQKRSKIGFWDAMVVRAAAESGCDVLWTEDLNDGQLLRGVRVRDPFVVR